MKVFARSIAPSVLVFAGCCAVVLAQPSLFPPGPPTVVSGRFGTRTEITAIPYTITAPGSYYLSATQFQIAPGPGITIDANDVTIDLNGHALIGGGLPGDSAITWGPGPAYQGVHIYNGVIAFWDAGGIALGPTAGANQMVHLHDLIVYSTTLGPGITLPPNSIARNIITSYHGGFGIETGRGCKITNVIAAGNASTGIVTNLSHVSDSVADGNGFEGMMLGDSTTVLGCVANQNAFNGFAIGFNCRLTDCTAIFNGFAFGGGDGFSCTGTGSILGGCAAYQNASSGFFSFVFGPPGANSAHDCIAEVNGFVTGVGDGFTDFNAVMQCTATGNAEHGIELFENAHVYRCTSNGNTVSGIVATGGGNVIEENFVTDNSFTGVDTTFNFSPTGNFVAANRAQTNFGGDYAFLAIDTTAAIFFGPGVLPLAGTSLNISFP